MDGAGWIRDDRVLAMALGSDNSVYVTGTTASTDFPTTQGSLQPTTSVSSQAFAAKLNPSGAVVYATYIGGTIPTAGAGIAVDSSGDAFITGYAGSGGVFATSPGAVSGLTNAANGGAYVAELNAAGSATLVAIEGFGGQAVAVDSQGSIYAAGAFTYSSAPVTPGAFQAGPANTLQCFTGFAIGFPCTYQHVAKIDRTGTKLIFATYLAGAYGAAPVAIAVDANQNVIIAGSTNSPDYPTTPGAYQPEYFADPEVTFQPPHDSVAPVPAGYVSKLNAGGTALVWSTLFAGSNPMHAPNDFSAAGDTISSMAVDASGNIVFAGEASSIDLPGLWSTPVALRPGPGGGGFVARLSADGTTLSPTQLIAGSASVSGIAVRSDGSVVAAGDGSAVVSGVAAPILATTSFDPIGRVAAIADTADGAKIVSVAPGQLLTLYGTNLAPTGSAPAGGQFPASLNGVTVTFNGIAAPILYTSGIQINLQVPYEIAGLTEVTMQVSSQQVSPPVSESYILAVVAQQPSVFLFANGQPVFDETACNGQIVSGLQPLAMNADGTQNSCANPAASGSVVTIFLNGLGVSSPVQGTGVVSTSAIPINPSASFVSGSSAATNFLLTATLPGSIDSVAQVQIQVSSTSSFLNIPLEAGSDWVRGASVLIWVK